MAWARIVKSLLPLVALVAGGCGSGGPPPTATVKGTVTYQGKRLASVRVEFVPEQETGDKFLRSIGTTDANGEFELMCDDGRSGAVLGWHKVVIASNRWNEDRGANPFEPLPPTPVGTKPQPAPLNLNLYSSVTTTPERREVVAGENTIQLKLK